MNRRWLGGAGSLLFLLKGILNLGLAGSHVKINEGRHEEYLAGWWRTCKPEVGTLAQT